MSELKYILAQGASSDRRQVGGKAAALSELDEKFTIPEWFVITPKAFLSCLSEEQIQKLKSNESVGKIRFKQAVKNAIIQATGRLAEGGHLLAVRSSATAEDGQHASFAGQLESYLNVDERQVLERVRDVWYSAFSDHVTHYRKTFSNSAEWVPAVIVQRMVKADIAGVAFSADPVTADPDTCVINATKGLADKLVSGYVNGDTYHTSRSGKIKTQSLHDKTALLNQEIISEIVALLLKVEEHFGTPQDVEWAVQDGKLYLLQARPITSLSHLPLVGHQITIMDNSNIVESYSGVTSPLTFSFARYVYEHVYIAFCKFMGVSTNKIEREHNAFRNMLGFVNGHVYYNLLNWYRVLALFPGFKMNQQFMEQMMGVKEPLPEDVVKRIVPDQPSFWEKIKDGFNVVRTLGGLIWHQMTLPKTIRRFYERLNDALSSSETLEKLPLDQLGSEYRTLESKLLKKWDAPLINDFLCMIAFGLSRKLLEKYAGTQGLNLHNDIMIGQGDIISAEPAIRIKRMAAMAHQEDTVVERLIAGDITALDTIPELKQEYEAYLEKFGDRCLQELKLESPTLHDNPTMLLQSIGHMARNTRVKKEPSSEETTRHAPVQAELFDLFHRKRFKRWLVTKMVLWAKARVRDRENLRFERTRLFGRVRKIFLEIGKRFHELKYINNPRDIFFLEVPEIMGLIEGTATIMDIKSLVESRAKQQMEAESQPAPPSRFKIRGAAYPAFKAHQFNSDASTEKSAAHSAKGIGCCQGVVKATVRVIRNPREATLKPGEIMVAEFTDPGWITLFTNAAGILVERGSLLSHSAIVAREMGIPAIVAIDGLMTWLKCGDVVEMNGATGVIRKIEHEGKHDNKK